MQPWVPESRFDRVLTDRLDDTLAATLWADPRARVLVVSENFHLSASEDGGTLRGLATNAIPFDPTLHYLVGAIDGAPWFAMAGEHDGPHASLRQVAGTLPDTETDLAMAAVALVNWHRVAPYCGRCGTLTEVREAGHMRWCPTCERSRFPRTDPAVIVAVLDAEGRLLLGHHVGWEDNRVSILAGFVEAGESLEMAVRREVFEEAGVHLTGITYVGSQPWPLPRSLMLGFVARTDAAEPRVDGEEILWANFYTPAELDAKVAAGELVLPMTSSIASRIIAAWKAGEFA